MIQKSKVHSNPDATPPPSSQPLPLATPSRQTPAATPSQYFPYELLDRMRQPDLHDPAPLTHAEQRLVESGRPADHPPIPKPEPRLMPRAGDHTPPELPLLHSPPPPRAHPPPPVQPPPPPHAHHPPPRPPHPPP